MSETAAYAVVTYTSLLAIINPLGAVPLYLALTGGYAPDHRRRTVLRAIVTSWMVLVAFALLGAEILRFFGITTHAFKIAGGILFFGIGWDMLQARRSRVKSTPEEEIEGAEKSDIGIIPLGIPTLAGPGAITTIIALVSTAPDWPHMLVLHASIVAVLLTSLLVLLVAPLLFRVLGRTGLNVLTRLMGLLVMVIGVQFVIDGVRPVVAGFLTADPTIP